MPSPPLPSPHPLWPYRQNLCISFLFLAYLLKSIHQKNEFDREKTCIAYHYCLGDVPDAVRETVRHFALKEVAPRAQEIRP